MIQVSREISSLKPYVPGKPLAELERELGISGAVKLASNENPLGPSRKALAAIRGGLKDLGHYPDAAAFSLKEALSERWKLPRKQIVIGNGSNEVIELLVRAFILPGDEVVMAQPTFSLYHLMVQAAQGLVVSIPLEAGRHNLGAMERAVTPKTKLIFVCNPNNPTGTLVDHAAVAGFLSRLPSHVLVVFDEAYAEYVEHPEAPRSVALLKRGAPLMILRTFSKIYGLAGLRVGYGLGPPEVIDFLNRVRQPFNVSLPAQMGAWAALQDEGHVLRSRALNRRGKAQLSKAFDRMGLSYFPTEANFIYFRLKGPDAGIATRVWQKLLTMGVIIRDLGTDALRVTVGRSAENRRFIAALEVALSDRSSCRQEAIGFNRR